MAQSTKSLVSQLHRIWNSRWNSNKLKRRLLKRLRRRSRSMFYKKIIEARKLRPGGKSTLLSQLRKLS
jgi:hypothetical protein